MYNVVIFFFVIISYLLIEYADSVRILEMRVSTQVPEDGETLLGCEFDMEGDILYSVKWYKDGKEFYRYVPRRDPPISHFFRPGVIVDESRSSSNVVSLVHLSQDSSGVYRCEVSGEAPYFATAYEEKTITVYILPKTGPVITGLRKEYRIGDRAVVNCSSARAFEIDEPSARAEFCRETDVHSYVSRKRNKIASKPEALLKWLINDQPVPRDYLQGPWYRMSYEHPDATETILQMRFTVELKHFQHGVLKMKCQATIAPLYQKEAVRKTHFPWASSSASPYEDLFPTLVPYDPSEDFVWPVEVKQPTTEEEDIDEDKINQTYDDNSSSQSLPSLMIFSSIALLHFA